MGKISESDRRRLALDAQTSVWEAASSVWANAIEEPSPAETTVLKEVRFGGVRRLARSLASAAIKQGAEDAAQAPSLSHRNLRLELLKLSAGQRTKLFIDALRGINGLIVDGASVHPRVSPIRAFPYPSGRQPTSLERNPFISVYSSGRKYGRAALVVSLWRPPQEAGPMPTTNNTGIYLAGEPTERPDIPRDTNGAVITPGQRLLEAMGDFDYT